MKSLKHKDNGAATLEKKTHSSRCESCVTTIYKSTNAALEYALLCINLYFGCPHGCVYCFERGRTVRFNEPGFDTHQYLKPGFLEPLEVDAAKFQGTDKRVLMSFSTDPYQPLDDRIRATRRGMEILIGNDIPFTVLTKGGLRAVRDFDVYRPGLDAFAVTLTSLDEAMSLKWEPGAALPNDRIAALREAHDRGIFTWVPLEPVLDAAQTLAIIEATHDCVDHFMIGKLNRVSNNTDWRLFGASAVELCQKLGKSYYVKEGLRKYLDGVSYTNIDIRRVRRNAPRQG